MPHSPINRPIRLPRSAGLLLALALLLALGAFWLYPRQAPLPLSQTLPLADGDYWLEADIQRLAATRWQLQVVDEHRLLGEWRGAGAIPARAIIQRRHGRLLLRLGDQHIHLPRMPDSQSLQLQLYNLQLQPGRRQKLADFRFADDFGREAIGKTDGWEQLRGTWRTLWNQQRAAVPNRFVASGISSDAGPAILLAGADFWCDYTLQAAIKPQDAKRAGLIVAWQGPDNFHSLTIAGQALELTRHHDGQRQLLHRQALRLLPDNWYRLGITVSATGDCRIHLDHHVLTETHLPTSLHGRIGLITAAGSALFDDLQLASTPPPDVPADPLQPLQAASVSAYSTKPRYAKDDRDDHLERWAKDADAWQPSPDRPGWYRFHLPLFPPFRLEAPPQLPIHRQAIDGGAQWIHYQPLPDHPDPPQLLAGSVRQDFFEQAPADWLVTDGTWEMTNRWQCEQRWGFYGGHGPDAVIQFSKHSYHGNQVHEFYYGMKDLFNREFENRRYARHDVNFSFMTDGRDLFSGYTFLFGGHGNTGSYLYRYGQQVAHQPDSRFDTFEDIDDLHLFWRRFRFTVSDGRIRIFHDDQLVIDYQDPDPTTAPGGGQVALWTYRNGLVYGRFNSSAASLRPIPPAKAPPAINPHWQPLQPGRVSIDAAGWATNHWGGGSFAIQHPLPQAIDLTKTPRLVFDLEIPADSRVNLHLVISGRPLLVPLTAPVDTTYHVLGHQPDWDHRWRPYVATPISAAIVDGQPRDEWPADRLELNLAELARHHYPDLTELRLESLIIGNSDHHDYLLAGLGGNHAGARYRVGPPDLR